MDTESDGFNAHVGKPLRMVQVGDKQTGWSIPHPAWSGFWTDKLNAYEGPLVFHNAVHDIPWLVVHSDRGRWRPPWERIDDTMTMAHLDDPTRPRGLKALADREVDPRASAGEKALHDGMKAQGWTWGTVPYDFAPYWVYAALDPVLTCHVWDRKKYVTEQFKQSYQIEMAATRIATNMKMHGAYIDVPYTEKAIGALKGYSGEIRAWLKQNFGVTSPMSGGQIGKVVEQHGIPIQFWTDGGAAQFDKDALIFYGINYPDIAPFTETIRAVRQSEKIIGTYLENFLSMRDANDLLHPSLWVNGAVTTRMSCSDPNLQNLIRDDKIVRGAFIPHPGMALISIDANQIEQRLVAHFSGDAGLIEAFLQADATGTDFFSIVASEIFKTPIDKKDPRRQRTKNTMYAKSYGAKVPKMALTAGIPVAQMEEFHAMLIARFPGLDGFMQACIREASQNAHRGKPAIYTPTGRRLLLNKDKIYTSANYKIQGHAAELLKIGANRLDAAGYGPYMVLPVHDEIILEAPENQAEAMLAEAEQILANRTDYAVPITWEGSVMRERWVKG